MIRKRYLLILQPEPTAQTPEAVRLRWILKRLLRTHGMRCVACREIQEGEGPPKEQKASATV